MIRKKGFFGIVNRKERWGLSWKGWLVIGILIIGLVSWSVDGVYPFLAVTERVNTNVLVVEGWVHEYAIRAAIDEFNADHYERLFTTGGPIVGTGLLATRDSVAWLRHGASADNPAAGRLEFTYGHGRSQCGRFLRQFVYDGLNLDEEGRQVFDGLIPDVAGARRGEFNQRYGQPSETNPQGFGGLFPFTSDEQTDPVRRDFSFKKRSATASKLVSLPFRIPIMIPSTGGVIATAFAKSSARVSPISMPDSSFGRLDRKLDGARRG